MFGGAKRRKSSSRKTRRKSSKRGRSAAKRNPKSLGEVMRKVPETRDTFLNWLAEMKSQGKLEKLIRGALYNKRALLTPPKASSPELKERYEFVKAMIKLLILSKIPQIERALMEGKDWRAVIKNVKDPNEIDLYADYFKIRNAQRGGENEDLEGRLKELVDEARAIDREINNLNKDNKKIILLESKLQSIADEINEVRSLIYEREQRSRDELRTAVRRRPKDLNLPRP